MIIKNRASTEFYLGKNFINKTEGKAQLKLTSTAQQPYITLLSIATRATGII